MILSIGPTRRLVVAGAAFLLPRVAMSDPTGPRRIGYLVTGTNASNEISTAAFREELRYVSVEQLKTWAAEGIAFAVIDAETVADITRALMA